MKRLMSEQLLKRENQVHAGTGGRSQENAGLGFKPAFFDFATQTIYPSRFADGRLAPFHILDGLPEEVVVDRLPTGEYELIDYKTGRPKSAIQLADDVQLSLYAVGAREAWNLDASRQAYYYLLDDQKVSVPDDDHRADWISSTVRVSTCGKARKPPLTSPVCASS